MAFDEALAARIRKAWPPDVPVAERKMFGGLAFLEDGKLVCGIVRDELMVRVGPEAHPAALARKHVRPMDLTGRPMKGFVFVAPPGVRTAAALRAWVEAGRAYAAVAKPAPKRKAPRIRPERR